MLFSLTNPEVAIFMMGIFLFAVLLGFPIAFTLMAMGVGFGYYAYYDATMMEHIFTTTRPSLTRFTQHHLRNTLQHGPEQA